MTAALAITHCMELTQGRYSAPTLKSQLHSEASRNIPQRRQFRNLLGRNQNQPLDSMELIQNYLSATDCPVSVGWQLRSHNFILVYALKVQQNIPALGEEPLLCCSSVTRGALLTCIFPVFVHLSV